MNDTRRRFLREIAGKVDTERVVEVHLFQPLRHDGRETGVAVVAVTPPPEDVSGGEIPDVETSESWNRLIVYRAMYRLAFKGPDRGKWELELVAEADAPLLAVEDVVSGVHRRTGEEIAPERLSGEAFRAALHEEPWSASAQ
jgi:hypothetical protein